MNKPTPKKRSKLVCIAFHAPTKPAPLLVFLQKGGTLQTDNGFVIAKISGWYCPICGGSYGK